MSAVQRRVRNGRSLWLERGGHRGRRFPSLSGRDEASVAISRATCGTATPSTMRPTHRRWNACERSASCACAADSTPHGSVRVRCAAAQASRGRYARWTADHRLLRGGGDRLVRPGLRRGQQFAAATDDLRAYFETRLPALSDIKTEFAWEGLFAMTPDSLPYIGPHRRYPRQWFALGYGGNGMTFGLLAARLLLERWQGKVTRDHALFEFGRTRRR
jgi:glycine/D-amino acid oxidase-like deaminating enzyme